MESRLVGDLDEIVEWKRAYFRSLAGPLDGYWEGAVIGLSPHYEIVIEGQRAGYFAAKDDCLLQFHVADVFLPAAPELFAQVVAAAAKRRLLTLTSV